MPWLAEPDRERPAVGIALERPAREAVLTRQRCEPDDADEDEPFEHEQPLTTPVPSPSERLLHALGQLHRLYLCGRLPAHPSEFDVEDIARIVGVLPDLEFVVSDDDGARYHFAGEVLFITPTRPVMVRLLGVLELEFAAEQDLKRWWGQEGWG
jgi:hypothetical protein